MADPLSVTAGVIAVASLAYSSTKTLYELISTIRDAPREFQELNQGIAALSQIINTLKTNLDGRGPGLSGSQITCLQVARPTLEGCDRACKDFKAKVEALTAHSQDGRRSFRDSWNMKFQAKSIADFRVRVVGWELSLALALSVALFTSTSENTKDFEALEVKVVAAEAKITTDIEAVVTRYEKLQASEPESEVDLQIRNRKIQIEEQQKTDLTQCLLLCQEAAAGAMQTTGHSFRNNRVLGEARATYGDVGQVPANSALHSYYNNCTSGEARVVMGNMDGASFRQFMK